MMDTKLGRQLGEGRVQGTELRAATSSPGAHRLRAAACTTTPERPARRATWGLATCSSGDPAGLRTMFSGCSRGEPASGGGLRSALWVGLEGSAMLGCTGRRALFCRPAPRKSAICKRHERLGRPRLPASSTHQAGASSKRGADGHFEWFGLPSDSVNRSELTKCPAGGTRARWPTLLRVRNDCAVRAASNPHHPSCAPPSDLETGRHMGG